MDKVSTLSFAFVLLTAYIWPLSGHSHPQRLPLQPQMSQASLDLNGDGVISREEFNWGHHHQGWRHYTEDCPMYQQTVAQSEPVQVQGRGNGQGAMWANRGAGRAMPAFSQVDLNGDGLISKEEFIQFRNERQAQKPGRGYNMTGVDSETMFSNIDIDKNGFIDGKEFSDHQKLVAKNRW